MFGKNLEKERRPERSWRQIEGVSSELKEKGEQYEAAIRSALEGMGILPEEIKTIEQRRFNAVLENAIETAIERDQTGHGRSFDEFIEDNPPYVPARTFREEIMRVREKKALDIGLAEASTEWLKAREAYKKLLRTQDLSPLDLKSAGDRAREDLIKLGIKEGDPEWERKYGIKIREYTLGKLGEKDIEYEVDERFGVSYVGRMATRVLSNPKSPEYLLSRSAGRLVYTGDIADEVKKPSDFDKESKQSQEWREEKNIRLSYNNETNTFYIDSPIIERARTLIAEITETKIRELASDPERFLGKIKHLFDTAQKEADAYLRTLRTIASPWHAAGDTEDKILEHVAIARTHKEEEAIFKQLYTSAKILVGYLESYKRSVRLGDQDASMSPASPVSEVLRGDDSIGEKLADSPAVSVRGEDVAQTAADSEVSQFNPDKTQELPPYVPPSAEVAVPAPDEVIKLSADEVPNTEIASLPPPPPGSRVAGATVDSALQTGTVDGTVDESMPKGTEKGPTTTPGSKNAEKTDRLLPNKYFTREDLDKEHPKIPGAVEQLLKEHGAAGISTAVDKWFSDLSVDDRTDIKGMLNRELQDLNEQNFKEKSALAAELLRKIARGEEVELSAIENQDISKLESQFRDEVANVELMISALGPQLGFGKDYNEVVQAISNDERFKSVPLAAFEHKKKSLETFFDTAGKGVIHKDVITRWEEQCKEFTNLVQTIRETFDAVLPDPEKRLEMPTPTGKVVPQGGEAVPVAPDASAPEAPELPLATIPDANATQEDGTPPVPPAAGGAGGSGNLPPNGSESAEPSDGSLDRFSFHDVEVIDRELREALAKIDRSALDLFSVSDGSERITIDTLRDAIDLLLDVREMEDGDPKNLTVTERYGSLTHNEGDIKRAQKIILAAAPSFFNFLREERAKYAKPFGGEEGLEAMGGYRPDPEVLISEVQNFDELYESLKNIGSINGPRKTLLADEIIDIVKHVRAGEYTLDAVPIAYGLREKVDTLTKDEAIRIVEAGRRVEEARVAAAAATPVTPEPAPVSPEPIPTPPGGAGGVEQVPGEQPSLEGGDAGASTGSEVIFKHYVSNPERAAERQRIKASPEYQKARSELLEKRQVSAESEQKYQAALADFYKDLEGGEHGRIKRFGFEVGKIFGFKPSLSPELQKLKDEAGAAHEAYQQNGKELARIRKNLETDAYNQKVMAEYGRLLSQKILFNSLSGRTKIQREALEKIYPPAKKTLEWLATHPKTTFALGAGAFTLIGASGGALAGVAALGGYTASAGAGLVSGEATRRLLDKYYVGRKKEQLSTSRERAQTNFFDRKFSDLETLLEFREEAVDSARRTTTATSVGAAFAGGMAAGALYNAVTAPSASTGAEAVKPSESSKIEFDSAGLNESFDPPVSSLEAPQPPATAPSPTVETKTVSSPTPTPERPTFLASNGAPYATPELNIQPSVETVATPSSPDVSVEIMPDAEQVNAASNISEGVVSEQPAAAQEASILDDTDPRLNQAPEVIQVSANQPSVPENLDFAPQGGEVLPNTPNTEGYTSVGGEVSEEVAERAPAAVESAQKTVTGNSTGGFENDPSFPMGDGKWGTASPETVPQVMELDDPVGPAGLGSRAPESIPQKTVNMAEVGALGLAGLTVLGMQKRKSIWDSILSKGKFGGLIGLIFGGRKKKEVPPVKK